MSTSSTDKRYVWLLECGWEGIFDSSMDGIREVYSTLKAAERAEGRIVLRELEKSFEEFKKKKRDGVEYKVTNHTPGRFTPQNKTKIMASRVSTLEEVETFQTFWAQLTDDSPFDLVSFQPIFDTFGWGSDFVHKIAQLEFKS